MEIDHLNSHACAEACIDEEHVRSRRAIQQMPLDGYPMVQIPIPAATTEHKGCRMQNRTWQKGVHVRSVYCVVLACHARACACMLACTAHHFVCSLPGQPYTNPELQCSMKRRAQVRGVWACFGGFFSKCPMHAWLLLYLQDGWWCS